MNNVNKLEKARSLIDSLCYDNEQGEVKHVEATRTVEYGTDFAKNEPYETTLVAIKIKATRKLEVDIPET